ncbi:protein TRANSPARENT TESTA [Musa troglodytarum]|uniref:Protein DETOXIFICATION n=1 Tax=Musa troglodytarum TaxID=320322 RepID=A0A9E7L1I6_9LILI|nr:protein TRANSPARENT TESTA [Musa troglodytarum]
MITEEKEVPLLTNREVGEALEPGLPRRVWNESKKLWRIVGPAIFLRTTSYSMTLVTQAFAGHLGDLELAAMSLGMASALETLCGQAYGAKKHHMLGVYLQRSWIVLLGCAVLLLPLYIQATPLLELMGEPAELAREAGRVCIWFIPMHLSFAFLFPLNRFFQSQLKNSVSAVASGLVLAVHIFLSWLVVYKLDQGLRGASLTLCFSWWLQVLGQFAYVVCGGCPQTWKGFSMDAFLELWEFVKLSAASGVMLCLENWYYRVLILLTGSLKNAEIAVDAISICMNINNWELMIPLAFFAGTGIQPILSGVAVGAGWQATVAFVNVGSYYLIGIPVGVIMGWVFHLGIRGVWAGMIGGTAVQTVVLIYLTMRCDWDKEALKASARMEKWAISRKMRNEKLGMASALETLCGQAYGAKKHHMLGVYLQRSWIVLFGCAVLLLPLYIQATPLLELVVKPAELAREAGRVCIWFIPMHLSFAFLFPLNRFFQSQLKNSVSAVASGLVLAVHIFLSWLVVYKLDQGLRGASLTLCFSWWLQVLGQFAYVVCGGCPQTWKGFSMDAFLELWEFVKLSAASGVMLCLENWYYVVLILLPGSLKNAEIAVDAISICMTVNNWELMIPLAFFAGTGVRVANELGAGNSRGAKFATVVSLVTSTVIGLFNFCVIVVLHDKFALIFSSSTAVLDAVDKLNLLLAIPIQLNSIQPILSGVAVGAGWQATVAYVNVGSYYLIGIPVGVIMGWVFHLGVRGVWAGMIGGTAVQTVVLIYLTMRCDWDKEALKASERMEKWTISSLENWYYRVLILLTGSLKNAEIAVDAISICMNINNWELMIPLAFFAGTGVRVANELGAGNSRGAKFATVVSVVTSTVIGLFSCCVIVVFLDKFALIFSSSTVVLDAVDKLSLLLAIAILLNSIQPILSGVAVGAGWQATVAFVNVGSYYLISIPVRVIMGWVFHLGIRGVWAGMIGGTAVQTVVLIHLTMRCDWDKEALKASARMEKWAIVARRRKRDDTT